MFVTKLTDEDGNDSYEFKDKLGQVLLTRQMEGDIMHDTYYIYDSFGNLRAVLPPLASDLVRIVTNQDYATNQALANYAYLYKYDYRNRCIEKKLPGCAPIVYKYDYADRLIFTQDGEMKEKGVWMFSIPDVFGRVVLTGTSTQAPDVSDIVVKATRGGSYKGYNTSIALANAEIHTVNYYDDYSFLGQYGVPQNNDTNFEEDDEYGSWYSKSQKGMLTGTLTAQFTEDGVSNNYLYTVMYYDERGRVTQTKSNNHLGGMEKEFVAYNFTGQPKKRKLVHSGNEDIIQVYDYDYDHAGRLETVEHSVNGNPSVTLAANEYDELGRVEKTTHGGNANLDNNYCYNVRSWLKSKTGSQFNTALEYSLAGNISIMEWEQDNERRKYTYGYDGLSRLLSASFTGNATDEKYSTNYKYDKHGNILSLRREGKADSCYATIDSLAIRYQGNQMVRVIDKGMPVTLPESNVFEQGSTKSIQYAYNKNGAMTKDLNKKIADISYNVLNLPNKLVIDSTTHVYTYAADGRKLRVQQGEDKRDYAGSVIYENSSLKRILVDGGYVEREGSNWKYYFYINDHLGNNAVVADRDGNVIQNNSYYPFGIPMATASDSIQSLQPYKYNGKEFDRKDGLKLYDYGARHYDAQVGRFMTMDPMAEKYYAWSPYGYCAENPMNATDPDGRWILRLASAIGNAALDYASQVAANMATGSSFREALTEDISIASVVKSGFEGAINPVGATAKNVGKITAKTVIKVTLKEAGESAVTKVVDNIIEGKDVMTDVGKEAVLGGVTGNFKIELNNNNANSTINKMNKKMETGKTLTSSQQKQMNSAIKEKTVNIATENTVNTFVNTAGNVVSNVIVEDEKKKN